MSCKVDECGRKTIARGMCWKHYLRWYRHGSPDATTRPNLGSGRTHIMGYPAIYIGDNRYQLEHILMAERALGRPLPKGAEVHHVDRDKTNNNTKTPWNLIVCPSHAYHMLLHRRARALGFELSSPTYKLSHAQADEIRASRMPQRKAAALYGVSKSCIAAIRSGKLRPPVEST